MWQPHSRVGPPPTPDCIGACPAGSVPPCSVLGELEVTPVDNPQSGGESYKRQLKGPERGKLRAREEGCQPEREERLFEITGFLFFGKTVLLPQHVWKKELFCFLS